MVLICTVISCPKSQSDNPDGRRQRIAARWQRRLGVRQVRAKHFSIRILHGVCRRKEFADARISMMNTSVDTLSSYLKPLCSRDNHVMKYEAGGSRANTGNLASYHCGSVGCSVRYNSDDGYFMLIGMPDHANPVEEPGVNTLRCPQHHRWLYRRDNTQADTGVRWLCGVEGCDYCYSATPKPNESGPRQDFRR